MSISIEKKLPQLCPSCQSRLSVKRLHCSNCQTEVEGLFDMPILASFTAEEQQFIINFVKHSGSLKEMAKIMSLSYPTVRNYLDGVIHKIDQQQNQG